MQILNQFSLSGKTALVTGCNRGIGKAIAEALASAGADIIGVSATLEEKGSAIENSVLDMGRNFTAYKCDFSDRPAINNLVQELIKNGHGCPDILVNNAGTIICVPSSSSAGKLVQR